MSVDSAKPTIQLPAREIPIPSFLSEAAQACLMPVPPMEPFPPVENKEEWRAYISAWDASLETMIDALKPKEAGTVERREIDQVRVFDVVPAGLPSDAPGVILSIHGGGLVLCGGNMCRTLGEATAERLQRRLWSVDYRMPPEHLYPAALDDCITVYKALLREYPADQIIVEGGSAGGNLAAALMLRARDEGLPLPAGLLLLTPEVDLTESGDSFKTNDGLDALSSLMPVNLLYADGHDLRHPYLSPLFGDLEGLPPTMLTTGTRDLFLSNTVRMHRALRAAGVPAELHITEAAPHNGLHGSPEYAEITKELRLFVDRILGNGVPKL
jgi:monoterpene epsilon-lactone hydrolase